MSEINLIAALSYDGVIGKDNSLPWPNISADMIKFKDLTMGWPVIMGRKTWQSIPQKLRPLRNRQNVVISSSIEPQNGMEAFGNFHAAIDHLKHWDKVWVIGGGMIYKEALLSDIIDKMYLTLVDGDWKGDKFFPRIDKSKWEIEHMGGALGKGDVPDVIFREYTRKKL